MITPPSKDLVTDRKDRMLWVPSPTVCQRIGALKNISLAVGILLSTPALAAPSPPTRPALSELEAIVSEAPTLESFLQSPELLDRYFETWREYQGQGPISRRGFDAIITQLRTLIQKIPAIKEQAWRVNPHSTHSIPIPTQAEDFGRNLELTQWQQLNHEHTRAHLARCGGLCLASPEVQKVTIKSILEQHASEIRAVQALPKKARASVAHKLHKSRDLQAALSWFALQVKETPRFKMIQDAQDANTILSFYKEFTNAASKESAALFSEILPFPEELAVYLKEELFNYSELFHNKKVFPDKMREITPGNHRAVGHVLATELEVKPYPRKFHAIFDGIKWGECTGGGCANLQAKDLTPQRWALPLLESVDTYALESHGKHFGTIKVIHGEIQREFSDKLVANIEITARGFDPLPECLPGAQPPRSRIGTLLRTMDHYYDKKLGQPPTWVISPNRQPTNTPAMSHLLVDSTSLTGTRLSLTRPFTHGDSLAGVIARSFPLHSEGHAAEYGMDLNMISNISAIQNREAILLNLDYPDLDGYLKTAFSSLPREQQLLQLLTLAHPSLTSKMTRLDQERLAPSIKSLLPELQKFIEKLSEKLSQGLTGGSQNAAFLTRSMELLRILGQSFSMRSDATVRTQISDSLSYIFDHPTRSDIQTQAMKTLLDLDPTVGIEKIIRTLNHPNETLADFAERHLRGELTSPSLPYFTQLKKLLSTQADLAIKALPFTAKITSLNHSFPEWGLPHREISTHLLALLKGTQNLSARDTYGRMLIEFFPESLGETPDALRSLLLQEPDRSAYFWTHPKLLSSTDPKVQLLLFDIAEIGERLTHEKTLTFTLEALSQLESPHPALLQRALHSVIRPQAFHTSELRATLFQLVDRADLTPCSLQPNEWKPLIEALASRCGSIPGCGDLILNLSQTQSPQVLKQALRAIHRLP